MDNQVMSPLMEWSGHIDNCVYREDNSGTHVTTRLIYNQVLSPSVEWSGHLDNCVYPKDSSGTHVTTRLIYTKSCLPRCNGVDTLTIASTLKTAAVRMSPQLIYNSVLSPSMEWSGHIDNCVYPEDSSDTHVTQD
ncbi:hypothetical protein GQ457_14G013670 [Hibiscus cannabinus]